MCTTYAPGVRGDQKRAFDPGVMDTGHWVLNLGPLKEQWVLLTAEPLFWPWISFLIFHVSPQLPLVSFWESLSRFSPCFLHLKGTAPLSGRWCYIFLWEYQIDIVFGVLLPCWVSVSFKLLSFAGLLGLGYSTRLWNLQVPPNWEQCQMCEITKLVSHINRWEGHGSDKEIEYIWI